MKESEKLHALADTAEHVMTAYGLRLKAMREARSEKFVEDWLPLLSLRYRIDYNNGKYTFTTEEFGKIDFFPKANKVLVRRDNDWKKKGLTWIINNMS
jgi:hypothetical protein